MPKARVEKIQQSTQVSRTPVKLNSTGTPVWYKALMFALMLLGLAWLVVNYLAGMDIPFMLQLGPWNYAIGFGLFILGLLMTMGWH
ncbi:MAG: cell division protein CrgA [Corynebacterium sp.]|nr:cell division protein CrgA [Corynebacterium sp.]